MDLVDGEDQDADGEERPGDGFFHGRDADTNGARARNPPRARPMRAGGGTAFRVTGSPPCIRIGRRRVSLSASSRNFNQETTMLELKTGLAVATAAAALFALGAGPAAAQSSEDGSVKCAGVNSCKGTAECKTAKNDCKG